MNVSSIPRLVLVKGRADLRGRELQLVALDISEPNVGDVDGEETGTRPVGPPKGKAEKLATGGIAAWM